MAKKLRGQGTERVMKKLQTNIEIGQYYEAHQMYRTLYFRYLSQKKYEELINMLYEGSVLFFTHNQHNSGSDLAVLLINVLNESDADVTEEYIDKLGNLFSMMLPDSPERTNFLTTALKWSSKFMSDCISFGHPRLHQSVALTLWKEKNYQQSRYHFIHSTDGQGCATMLIEYHSMKGYASEVDLFIAQTVLQYLCLKNKSTASTAFHTYTEKHPAVSSGFPYLLPLLNFLQFLLQAIERQKLAYFRVLCEQYQPSLKRDPAYSEYVERIGQLFFGITPPPKQQGLFGNLLQSLYESLDDTFNEETEPVAGSSKETSTKVQQEDLD
ncbi:golgi to ER traffic protein 4 homolog [Caerostris darwini]|uniref:Golgi to ER traffic protein 4 homolog n=1 Tax=Caerostris darwini TaxID=1538125 RepID=A0AAV4RFC7_9ARAC|nr:golgi to ER traffic protein 4 homolog [Caerostris darwini]